MKKTPWICTDPDCAQHSKKIAESAWDYIEARELPDEKYAVCVGQIDLMDYSLEEIYNCITGYYSSAEEMVELNGPEGSRHISAECLFEQTPLLELCVVGKYESFEEAEACIKDYISKH